MLFDWINSQSPIITKELVNEYGMICVQITSMQEENKNNLLV